MDTPSKKEQQWERELLEKIALASLQELKVKRRWGIFFKLAAFAYLTAVLVLVVDWESAEKLADSKHTALVNLRGTIDATGESSADKVAGALQSAFEDKGTAGVVLRINSPGGSPVQSGIVYDEIRRLRAKHPEIPLYVVVEDISSSNMRGRVGMPLDFQEVYRRGRQPKFQTSTKRRSRAHTSVDSSRRTPTTRAYP